MVTLQVQNGSIERWSSTTSHGSGHTSYFSIGNVANHQDQRASAEEDASPERMQNRKSIDFGDGSPVQVHTGLEEKDCDAPNTETTVQAIDIPSEPPRNKSRRPSSAGKSQKRIYPARSPKSESSIPENLDIQATAMSPSACGYPGKHTPSAKGRRRTQRSQPHNSNRSGGHPASYRRSATDPFPFRRPTKLAPFSTHGALTEQCSYPDIAPLISDGVSILPHDEASVFDATVMLPFLDIYHEKDQAPNHPPQPVIDWTSPATRRREYAEIDKSCRGMRGLWRRLSPQWCQKNRRLSFHNERNGSDSGSVRRYRVHIPSEEENAGLKEDVRVREEEVQLSRPKLIRSKTSWSCFGEMLRHRKSGPTR